MLKVMIHIDVDTGPPNFDAKSLTHFHDARVSFVREQ